MTMARTKTLLLLGRTDFALTGPKFGCGEGHCGSCTVLVNGTAVTGCLYLAAFVDGADVVTIERPADGNGLDAVQEAFIKIHRARRTWASRSVRETPAMRSAKPMLSATVMVG